MNALPYLILVVAILGVGLTVWWDWSIWGECRAVHSWMYCARLLG